LVETSDRVPAAGDTTWETLQSAVDQYAELLAPTELTTVDTELTAVARSLAEGHSPAAAARAIPDGVRTNVGYEPGSTGVRTPPTGVYHGAPSTGLGVTVEITRLA
jgi:transglutaminase-like putative cysteine protease